MQETNVNGVITLMNKKYLYPKEYYLKGNNELILKNQQVLNEYIAEKVKLLIASVDKNSVIIEIILDVKELVEFDMNNSSIIGMPISKEYQKELVQRYDIVYVLGNIFSEYHLDLINNHKENIPSIDYTKYVIDYNELYDEALTDYFKKLLNIKFDDIFGFKSNRKKNKNLYDFNTLMETMYGGRESVIQFLTEYRGVTFPMPSPIPEEIKPTYRNMSYLASFTFPALIERTILDYLRDYYLKLGIKLLSEKDVETFNNDDNERRAMAQIHSNGSISFFDGDMLMLIIIDMIKKYKVFSKDEETIFNNNLTIGKILHCSKKDNSPSFFAKHFKKEYFYLLERMFNFLNTRNNTMHLINTNGNYFSIEFSSILLQLYWLSISEEIFDLKGCD